MTGVSELPEMENVDQFIPEGFALVPIQLINGQALSQAIGRYGIVDLYLPAKVDDRQKKLAICYEF